MERVSWKTVLLVFAWQLAASLCYYTIFAATPFFRDAFGLTRLQVGIVVTAISLGYASFVLPLGAITDRHGERKTLTFGLLGLSTVLLVVALAPTYLSLLVAVFVLGSLYGTAMPGTNKAIFDSIPPGRQNLAMGVKQVGVTAGSGISALLVTGLAGLLFWRAGFFVAAATGVGVAIAFAVFYRPAKGDVQGGYPDFGALLSNMPYLFLVAGGFFLGGALFTTTGYTVLYVEESIGAPVAVGGIVLALVQLFGSVGRVISGWVSDVLPGEPRERIASLLVVQAIGAAVSFVLVASTDSTLGAGLGFSVLGFFILGFTGVYYSVMATLVEADDIGGASAGGQLALTGGSLFLPPAFGFLADVAGYRLSWLMLAVLTGGAGLLLVVVVRSAPPTDEPALAR